MKDDKKNARHREVSAAAYRVLGEKGYDGASMLRIARAASASNETLYRWYGDKKGLFARLVQDNAAETGQILKSAIAGQGDALETLNTVAPVFLEMLLGDRAILLNRAAAAEPTGELGAAISAGGREAIQPLFDDVMQALAKESGIAAPVLTGWFLGLLVGDLQIKRVIGVAPPPTRPEIDARVSAAHAAFSKLVLAGN